MLEKKRKTEFCRAFQKLTDTSDLGQHWPKMSQMLPNLLTTQSYQALEHSSEVWLHITGLFCFFPPAGHEHSWITGRTSINISEQ